VIRLALRVPAQHAELVLAELLELAPAGVEERELDGVVEYAVYGAPGELPALPALHAAVGEVPIDVRSSEIPDDWSERWKRFHRPVLIQAPPDLAPRLSASTPVPPLHVRPPWAAPSDAAGAHEVVIDPGRAFGTGAHATTSMCLELLLAVAAADGLRGAALDVGAGSGVLAIAAAKLGYSPVLALDNDRESIAAIHTNACANGVEVDVRSFDLRREPLPAAEGAPALVLANLLAPLLLSLAEAMPQPAHLIASGLLPEQVEEVRRAFAARLSLRERARREQGEWVALWLAR
jgi:ribosomal protein L11 methyltransferase